MKRLLAIVVVLSTEYLFFPHSAHALEVSVATNQRGEVHVVGKGAAKNALILWEGVPVATATPAGTFNFTTEIVPVTCVGMLTDGLETLFVAVNGCTALEIVFPDVIAPVPVTGQTSTFAAGDDGDVRAGVVLPDPRFTNNGDGTITDNLTGLIWLRDADCDGTKTWADALAFANNLADGACGLTDGSQAGDWRLPNVRELQSLIDYARATPALPAGHPFVNIPGLFPSRYWSSTTLALVTTHAWSVAFFVGGSTDRDKSTLFLVLPVRGGL